MKLLYMHITIFSKIFARAKYYLFEIENVINVMFEKSTIFKTSKKPVDIQQIQPRTNLKVISKPVKCKHQNFKLQLLSCDTKTSGSLNTIYKNIFDDTIYFFIIIACFITQYTNANIYVLKILGVITFHNMSIFNILKTIRRKLVAFQYLFNQFM